MYRKSFLRTYTFLSSSLFARGAHILQHFLSRPAREKERDHPHRCRCTLANIGISSYREPFYLMYDPANAIDKTAHLSLTLYGDRLSRSFVCFIFPPSSPTTIVPDSAVFLPSTPWSLQRKELNVYLSFLSSIPRQ